MKCLTLIIASLLLTSVYGMNITNKTLSIDVDALPVGFFGELEGEIDLFFRDGPYDGLPGLNSQLIIGNNGKIFDFDDYTISQDNYIIVDGDTYIHIPYFSSEAYVGLIDYVTGTTNQIASFSQSALSWSNGFDLEVGDWAFSNETFDITHNFAAINTLNPNAEVIFADKMYFYSPESSFVEVPGEGVESALEVRPKSLIPAKGSIVETEIFNAYAADNTDYDIDMAYELDVFNFQAEEVCEVSINLEGPAGGDESGVLEWECYFHDRQVGESGYLEYELDEDTFNKTEKIYKTKIRQYFDPVERFFIVDIKPTFMDESTLTDYVTLFKIGENDTIHYLVEDASSDAEYGSSSIAPISNETYQVNNYTYKVMTNHWGADFTFYRAEFEGGIEPEEDELGDIENPSGTYPFSGDNTNLIGVSYFRVAEAPIADTITATEDHITYDLPNIFLDYPDNLDVTLIDYYSYSYGLFAQYFDRHHINGEYGDLIFRGPGEIYTQTLIHDMSSSMDSFVPISNDRYRTDISNGTLAREPLSEVDEALTQTLEEYIHNLHAASNYSYLPSSTSNLVYTYSATAGSMEYENGLIKKTYYIDSSDFDGINYSATLYAILTDKALDLVEVWEATDYISTSLASAMDEIGSSISATSSNFVYRFDPPESHELVVLDWSLELANALPNWPTNSNYGSTSPSPGSQQTYIDLNDVYTLSNDRILLVYPADEYENNYGASGSFPYSYGTNGVVVSIINPDGSLHYSNVESYVPYSATINEMSPSLVENPPRRVGIKYIDEGAFYVSISFINNNYDVSGAYSVLYYPNSNGYNRIVFDGHLIPNENDWANPMASTTSNIRKNSKDFLYKPWPNHSQTLYTFNSDVTHLSKYSLSLESSNTSSGSGDTPDLTSINARVASLESDLPVLESTLIDYTDVSDNSLSNALISQINASISTFSNSVDWASISSVDTNEINNRIDGISYINTLLANEVSQEIQNRSAAITALQDEIITLSGIVNNATNNPGEVSIEEAKSMMRDLRVGSSIIDVSNQQATITISLDQSSDLTSNWTENVMSAPMTIDTEDSEVQFYRIRMD